MDDKLERDYLSLEQQLGFYFGRITSYPFVPPENVYFCLTSRCNLRCKMCNVPISSNQNDELNTEECKKIIDQIVDLKINHLIFSGGEPLLRSDLFDLITYAVSKKIKMVDVITNGLLINKEVAQKLVKSGLTHITVSIDGLEEINDFIRNAGSFQKAMEAIYFINKYKNSNFPTLGINFVIMDCNINQIFPMIDLARIKKCNIVVLQPMLSDNTDMRERKKNELWVSEKNIPKLKEIIKEVIELKKTMKDLSIHVNEKILEMIPAYFAGLPLNENLKCYEGIVRIAISSNGDLWTCRGIYGNLKTKSLRNCWLSFKAKKIRQEIRQCQNHCLQSCIHLAELKDIYSEVKKIKISINGHEENKEYLIRLLTIFKNYKFFLERKLEKYSKNQAIENRDEILNELKLEIENISRFIEDLA